MRVPGIGSGSLYSVRPYLNSDIFKDPVSTQGAAHRFKGLDPDLLGGQCNAPDLPGCRITKQRTANPPTPTHLAWRAWMVT